jgi:hypothetical protein
MLSPGVVCGADPGSGLYEYPKRDFEVVFSIITIDKLRVFINKTLSILSAYQ